MQGLKLLLQQGEDPDAVDYTGCSAVHVAAANGHDKILDVLKKAGADMDKRDVNVSHCMYEFGNVMYALHQPLIRTKSSGLLHLVILSRV